MRHLLITTTLLLIVALQLNAQNKPNCEWVKVDTTANISVNPTYIRTTVGASAGKVLWARALNKKGLGSQVSIGDNELVLFDSAGNSLKAITIEGGVHFEEIKSDNAGNWYLSGRYYDSLKFPGKPTYYSPGFSAAKWFLCKLSAANLGLDWFHVLGETASGNTRSFSMYDGKLYSWGDSAQNTTIYAIDMATGSETTLVKQEKSGFVSSISTDSKGNIYVTGSCMRNNAKFGTHSEMPIHGYNEYIVRYNANGQFDWINQFTDITCGGRQVNVADDNTIYYTGPLNDSMTIGSTFIKKPFFLGGNILVASFDSTGAVNWAKSANDSLCMLSVNHGRHAITIDGKLTLVYVNRGETKWGNGVTVKSDIGYYDVALVNFDKQGNAQWEKRISANHTRATGIAYGKNAVWVAGAALDDSLLTVDSIRVQLQATEHTQYLSKLTFNKPTTNVTSNNYNSTNDISIYPNPAREILYIQSNNAFSSSASIKLIDATGRTVLTQTFNSNTYTQLNVSTLAKGLYFVELRSDSQRILKKILLH